MSAGRRRIPTSRDACYTLNKGPPASKKIEPMIQKGHNAAVLSLATGAALLLAVSGASIRAAHARKTPDTPESAAAKAQLAAILKRFDETQASTRTLTASFTERKEIAILKDPIVARGRFYYTKPDDVLLQYTEPEVRYLLFTKDEQLFYFPKKKRAERGTSARVHDYIFRFFAIGQSSDTLKRFYDIELEDATNDIKSTYLLVLKPRKRMVRKAVQDVRLWIDRERLLPVRMQWREPDGDSTTISFEDLRFNPEIQASVYRIEIPKDVEIIKRRVPGAGEYKEKGEG